MILLITTGVLLCAALCYNIYKSNTSDLVKIISLPAALIFGLLVGWHYLDSLGKPIQGYPDEEFEYVYHEDLGDTIELWAVIEGESKLYTFPYTEEVAELLDEARQMESEGVQVTGDFTDNNNEADNESEGEVLNIRPSDFGNK